jgi:integrase
MSVWTYSTGERPHTVTVYEREQGGVLYARAWDANARDGKGNWRRVSLGHRDKRRAKSYAKGEAEKLETGQVDAPVTLARVFTLYQEHRTVRKSKREQVDDARKVEMWTRILGADKDPHTVTLQEWEAFIDARMSGRIDPRGNPRKDPKPIRARAVEIDCKWLRTAFAWAAKWRLPSGQYLMREDPTRGYEAPRERNPRRPVATQDRYEAIRAKAEQHTFEIRRNGKRERTRSYLPELMDIVNGTGRRISAVLSLRFDDLRLERTKKTPHGAIRWPADTDKMGVERTAPIGPEVRAALDRILRDRPGVGRVPLFPAPGGDPMEPMSRRLASAWLVEAEKMAGVEPQKGSLWHAYRRKWATERKHLPDVDVAAAGGWESLDALKQSYQQADDETMLQVVLSAGQLREAR